MTFSLIFLANSQNPIEDFILQKTNKNWQISLSYRMISCLASSFMSKIAEMTVLTRLSH